MNEGESYQRKPEHMRKSLPHGFLPLVRFLNIVPVLMVRCECLLHYVDEAYDCHQQTYTLPNAARIEHLDDMPPGRSQLARNSDGENAVSEDCLPWPCVNG